MATIAQPWQLRPGVLFYQHGRHQLRYLRPDVLLDASSNAKGFFSTFGLEHIYRQGIVRELRACTPERLEN